MDQTTIITLVGMAGTISGIVFGYIGYKKGLQKDAYGEGIDKANRYRIHQKANRRRVAGAEGHQ